MNRYTANSNAAYTARINGNVVRRLNNIRTADQTVFIVGLPPRCQLVLTCGTITEVKFSGSRVRVNLRTIHQLGARGCDHEVARHLHAYRVLERHVAIERIEEEHRA